MHEVVIVVAVRSPIGKRNGSLSTVHAVDSLGTILLSLFERTGLDPIEVGQVVGGCVGQVGMQSMNVTRTAWLTAGLPIDVPATTVDTQCGSSQQAFTLTYSMIAAGLLDMGIACGVEVMSKVPMGSTSPRDPDVGKPINRNYWKHHEFTTQFEGAERLAEKWGISRTDADAFALESQVRAASAVTNGHFERGLVAIDLPNRDAENVRTTVFSRDETPRQTTFEALSALKPTGRPNGIHTAGSSSQIADGASAVLMMSAQKASSLGLEPLATIVDSCLVGCDPVLMLEGPIPATRRLLSENKISITDIDIFEINEAFAAVVLAWQRTFDADMSRVNPNGGAIALGHPLGATGTVLISKASHEMVRTDKEWALVTMCCGGGLGTGTLLRRG